MVTVTNKILSPYFIQNILSNRKLIEGTNEGDETKLKNGLI